MQKMTDVRTGVDAGVKSGMLSGMVSRCRSSLSRRNCSDSGDGNLVSALFVIPMFFFLLISVIDVSMYFLSSSNISNAARDGAQNVSAVAGTGTVSRVTALENGFSQSKSRSDLRSGIPGLNTGSMRLNNTQEYLLAESLSENTSLYRVVLEDVNCGVDNGNGGVTRYVSHEDHRPFCNVSWSYDGLPLSMFAFVGNDTRDTASSVSAEVLIGDARERTVPRG